MNPDDERESFWKAVHTVDDRVTALEATVRTRNEMMREAIKDAVREAMPSSLMSDDEYRWVKLAIQREAESATFRRAVIEKTFIGLVWAGIVALGFMVRDYAIAHGMWRP